MIKVAQRVVLNAMVMLSAVRPPEISSPACRETASYRPSRLWENFTELHRTSVRLVAEDKCLYTNTVRYEWDPQKTEANRKHHGVSFADAVSVFEDYFALTREDPDAEGEQRFVTLGSDLTGALLVVVYTYREPDIIRLISAWKANKAQRIRYEKHRR